MPAVASQPITITGSTPALKPVTLGVIVGNRGVFPGSLALSGRETILDTLEKARIHSVILPEQDTRYGAVESLHDAQLCADLFRQQRDVIDGVLVTLPNFGDERAVANTLRLADLNVPVLVHAFADEPESMGSSTRRDSFCGKISVCNNLQQYGIPYSLTDLHTVDPGGADFEADLRRFAAVCRIVRGLRRMRVGMLGARTTAFNTVRFSEKVLERHGISVETLDLSEAFGRISRMGDDDPEVEAKRRSIHAYVDTSEISAEAVTKLAKLGVVVDRWMTSTSLDATAIQCWTSMQEFFGVAPCTIMSMASNSLMPSACETDIVGTISMYALALASGEPSALVDWNNNYGRDPDKAIVFHCSNLPKKVFIDVLPRMDYMLDRSAPLGRAEAAGTVFGRVRENPFTYLRVATDDLDGSIRAYLGEGEFTSDPVSTYGGYGVVQVPRLQALMRYICKNGFEHHVAINQAKVSAAIHEALTTYLKWDVYFHS
jgi:L-fucose isomerase-like protein